MRTRLTRWLPALTTGLGVIHLIWVVADLPDEVHAMLTEGFVGTSNNDSRDFATWFFIGGLVLLMIGTTMRWSVRHFGRIPTHLGWWILAIGLFDTLLEPNGGGYAQILLGSLTLAAQPIEPASPEFKPALD
ncbi:hypothetical protein GCM10029976_007330 [Kribbella albertanoniae]|uniref:Uncharacterized protein n=1 Tax=Kribbella albertanoniae TaxID=1266829 RepID=A0A4R4PWE9_9ACTN|nr:DUF6463 family protein [Kribbella albertanoniae]TDC26623.1 hypothetical protein E1261_22115 [Kribbella albertanoniae]